MRRRRVTPGFALFRDLTYVVQQVVLLANCTQALDDIETLGFSIYHVSEGNSELKVLDESSCRMLHTNCCTMIFLYLRYKYSYM